MGVFQAINFTEFNAPENVSDPNVILVDNGKFLFSNSKFEIYLLFFFLLCVIFFQPGIFVSINTLKSGEIFYTPLYVNLDM